MKEASYSVYLLECDDGSLYTGITTDIERRFREHRDGSASKYTASRTVKAVVYQEHGYTKGEALSREYEIKQLTAAQKRQLVNTQSGD